MSKTLHTTLGLFADEYEFKYYLNIESLVFIVTIFSKILNTFFSYERDDSCDNISFLIDKALTVKEKSEDDYDIYDMNLGLSLVIAQSFINAFGEEFVAKKEVFYTMFENYCHLIRFSQSIDDEFDAGQKKIGFLPS